MTPAEGRQVIDLVMEIMDVVKSVPKDEKALKNSGSPHSFGAIFQHHKDKRLAKSPYIYSLAFFVYKWNEKSLWKKDLISRNFSKIACNEFLIEDEEDQLLRKRIWITTLLNQS